ncbi:MAG: type II toxin-antitoxin system VapB family antitoxin [Oscillospiraceae bacterium]|nr:type II toxin-antitoxin system VapB family antitoxin [Oscillospiraceae bacterium]
METAKLFANGQSQAVRLPKEYRFSGDEVYIKKVGTTVMLFPKERLWETFMEGLNELPTDFMADGRPAVGELPEREPIE